MHTHFTGYTGLAEKTGVNQSHQYDVYMLFLKSSYFFQIFPCCSECFVGRTFHNSILSYNTKSAYVTFPPLNGLPIWNTF